MAVFGAFFVPLRHLPFDHAGVDAVASWLGAFLAELPKERFAPLLEGTALAGVAFRMLQPLPRADVPGNQPGRRKAEDQGSEDAR